MKQIQQIRDYRSNDIPSDVISENPSEKSTKEDRNNLVQRLLKERQNNRKIMDSEIRSSNYN